MKKVVLFTILVIVSVSIMTNVYAQNLVQPWIKNTAKWYGDGLISEREFLDSITFLIDNDIIKLAEKQPTEQIDLEVSLIDDAILTKPRLNQCVQMHAEYKKLGESLFLESYDHKNYVNACIKLYKDPLWKYEGKDKVTQLYEKFLDIRAEEKSKIINPDSVAHVDVLHTTNIGKEKYLVKLTACAGNVQLDKVKILVKSEIEAIQIGSTKDIFAETCRNYETQIYAKYPENIVASIIEKVPEQLE